jgi:hypothetical protein
MRTVLSYTCFAIGIFGAVYIFIGWAPYSALLYIGGIVAGVVINTYDNGGYRRSAAAMVGVSK